ncbi:hypothetical protein PORY_000273 [Pneumocystis oryctolagi]|uniref:Uncharacterized protein n=1 Tax=Pneumocystis oryctolagi TaxID=42067 RepID=A0ACB7CFW3_9ASCO|nr:hypothetical protein PORY_000273 [Pneumocystis oryctolagi]
MGNIHGKQTFYDKKQPVRRLTKRKKNSGSRDVPILQNRYTGVPVHRFTDIFDPGTNLVSKSEEFCSLPKYTKTKSSVPSMYIDVSNTQSSVYGEKDNLKPRSQYPSRRYRIDPINSRMSYQYFPSRPFHRQSISHTIPRSISSRHGSSISSLSRYNTHMPSLNLSNEMLPTSFPVHLENKRSTLSSNTAFGLASPGVLRVVNGLPSPCSSDDEFSPQPFSQDKSHSLTEKESLKHLAVSEPDNTLSQDMLEHDASCSSTTEQLLMEYYSDKDRSEEEYLSVENDSEMELRADSLCSKKMDYSSIFKTQDINSNYSASPAIAGEALENVADYSFQPSRKQDAVVSPLEHFSDVYANIHTFDLSAPQTGDDFHGQHPSKNTKPCSTFNSIELPSLFVSDQRIAISG